MANDTASMSELFPACHSVLRAEMKPIHYGELTRLALQKINIDIQDINWQRQIEDVREKLLCAGRFGCYYIGEPYCVGVLQWWFNSDQARMFNPSEGVIIKPSISDGINGGVEALMRDKYMIQKSKSVSREDIVKVRVKGLVIEHHVSSWFAANWPEFYIEPDNFRNWSQPCYHDFKLNINDRIIKVDVTGKKMNGEYGNPGGGKKPVDFHLACEVVNNNIVWKSVFSGSSYASYVFPEGELYGGTWPERMIVWLNCEQEKINYTVIKSHFKQAKF